MNKLVRTIIALSILTLLIVIAVSFSMKEERRTLTMVHLASECKGFDISNDINDYRAIQKELQSISFDNSDESVEKRIALWKKIQHDKNGTLLPPIGTFEAIIHIQAINECLGKESQAMSKLIEAYQNDKNETTRAIHFADHLSMRVIRSVDKHIKAIK